MNENLFKDKKDYWRVADTIKQIYMSGSSLAILLDFERVLDEIELYAFRNWKLGELVEGPEVTKYNISCTFSWPVELMPDPRGAKRLLPYGCVVKFKKTKMKMPIEIRTINDYEPGTKMGKLIDRPIWLVEICMPKELMSDIRTGSIELEDQSIDLEDLNLAYEQDLDNDAHYDTTDQDVSDEEDTQEEEGGDDFAF